VAAGPAGAWTIAVNATWNGFKGRVPGLPDPSWYIFVLENGSQSRPRMTLKLSEQQTFSPTDGLEIHGNSSASEVYFAAITPRAVLEEGFIPVVDGQFTNEFNPKRWPIRLGPMIS